ncbi:YggS family pyridoxal phosphate-dependent enzyme [Geminocystis sp. GBBB08]|uniref:YggS family pyridoxal phosphate-dependent enzyme n=1 Tax=Geminocystis sp. GBBB08 TaxID=2604140 RepID=UPI0027E2FEE7|nr:YggS family pyridoxal phosphate-dependent enzyme [Geminocystis sp. GBBB08]MBL1211397.1 YggS family pyridoxal phosphate-dependent enzyme [Geminocystis sp. GBBB08]
MSNPIVNNLQQIQKTIPSHVRLIAVTKTVSVEMMKAVYEVGVRDFAENKLQEAINKQNELRDFSDICWHFIGHLQTNKAKKAVESFLWIHSVDSLKLAQKLDFFSQQALKDGIITTLPQVCLQVKILPDQNKYGWNIDHLYQDLSSLQKLTFLHFRGLMTILPLGLTSAEVFSAFQEVTNLALHLRQDNYFSSDFDQLSMGMSGDYLLAMEAGATMIRLGTIIFGDR